MHPVLHQVWGPAIVGLPGLAGCADVQALFSVLTESSVASAPIGALGILGWVAAIVHVCSAPSAGCHGALSCIRFGLLAAGALAVLLVTRFTA